jgi:hypothetical protein
MLYIHETIELADGSYYNWPKYGSYLNWPHMDLI